MALVVGGSLLIGGSLLAWTPWADDHHPIRTPGKTTVVTTNSKTHVTERRVTTSEGVIDGVLTGPVQHLVVAMALLLGSFVGAGLVKRAIDGDLNLKMGPLELQEVRRVTDEGMKAATTSIEGLDARLRALYAIQGLPYDESVADEGTTDSDEPSDEDTA